MSKVVIKTVKRKTTISKAAINKAAKIAYSNATAGRFSVPVSKPTSKSPKAA